ncbi:MAG TPA: FAD-dependent oxidoreductase [Bacteroidales bacterium]|nr:FAD-dependent oxidoreductase [Bacteroidales bacterium]
MKNLNLLVLILILLLSGCNNQKYEVLIETESFSDKGGWVVDPQFVFQMGSPYLLAHGLGRPVEDAVQELDIPAPGKYNIWVRTMNWAVGEWDAPGRFRVLVDGKELDTDLGTNGGWGWQYAGDVKIKDKVARVGLHDLTGFEGRCDAIYLSTVKTAPPSDLKELTLFRKTLLKESDFPQRKESFDLVVVGGGIAGCAASIAAAEQGMKVALIHDRPILGGNASSEIRVHTEGITWKSGRILNMLNTVHWPNGSPDAVRDDRKRHNAMSQYPDIHQFLNFKAYSANTISDSITSVDAKHTSTGETIRFSAPIFIDCTGDGWIGYWAGAEYMYGREDSLKYNENWDLHKELWSPVKADNRVMGSSLLWRSVDKGVPVLFPEVPWAMDVAGDFAALQGEWEWEYSVDDMHQVDDAEAIRDHMFKAVYGSFYNAKKIPENASFDLDWVSFLIGKRESRRLVGDYIYTFQDEKNMVEFPDAVAMEQRDIDVHYQQNLKDNSKPDFLSVALFYPVDHYYIPYRSLYSKNIRNLLMAGRCFSCSHVGLGGPRVMNTTGQMGVATGYAASLCKKYNTSPRGIYMSHIKELQKLIGGK